MSAEEAGDDSEFEKKTAAQIKLYRFVLLSLYSIKTFIICLRYLQLSFEIEWDIT